MNDKEALLAVTKDLRERLFPSPVGIRMRPTITLADSYTKGWRVELARMSVGQPRLELWFDHWADPDKRRFWYGFSSQKPSQIKALTKTIPAYLQPKRTFKDEDVENVDHLNSVLKTPLRTKEFGPTFDEYYKKDGTAFYGKFDFTSPNTTNAVARIAHRAAAFFRDTLEHQKKRKRSGDNIDEDVYPHIERTVVRRHLSRERSRALAAECKIRDDYQCRVCGITFEEVYGDIGSGFAEAHHVIPLHRLPKTVESTIKHLITVCSNCHRMLHRMRGESGDVQKLKQLMK